MLTPLSLLMGLLQACMSSEAGLPPLSSSPLLFIIVIDALIQILNQETSTLIEVVSFPEIILHQVHNIFVANLALIKLDMSMVNYCQHLLDFFGQASALFYDWSKTKAASSPTVPSHPLFGLLDGYGNLLVMLPSFRVSIWANRFWRNKC